MKPIISTTLRLTFTILIIGLIASCNGSSSKKTAIKSVGLDGGSITSGDGLLTLDIPAGALADAVEITVERVSSATSSLLMYQLSPSGLEFSVPAHMTVDVSSIMATSDATEFNAKVFPGIITTALDGMGVEVLDNLALTVDADANSFLLGGDVSHFSGFVVGGNSNLSASIEKVPQFWPANTDFGPVEVNVSKGARTIPDESLIIINYSDNSVSPVIIKGTAFRALSPTPAENQTKTYLIEYACGDPGVGTYKATLLFVTYST